MPSLLLILLPVVAALAPVPGAGTVTVNVTGANSDEGQIVVLLWSDDDGFPRDASKAAHRTSARLSSGSARVRLTDVPEGRYAVMAFHDADADGVVDTNVLRMPKEGIALSNWSGGRPRFDRSLVSIGRNTTVSIELTYM